jgi:predicted transposase YbfD/YdcC
MRIAPAVCWRNRGVGSKQAELSVAPALLGALSLRGRVVTGDALWAQREICEQIVREGGDYLFLLKANQPTLLSDVQTLFADPGRVCVGKVQQTHVHADRWERRCLEASEELVGYSEWPHLGQVMRIERQVQRKGEQSEEVCYAITSLRADQASAKRLLSLNRGHWGIENRLHYVRDVTLGEDACQIRTGSLPQVMAALRSTVIGLLRQAGVSNIAAALRRNAARPQEALTLIGVQARK